MAFPASQPNLTAVPYGTITLSHLWTIPEFPPSHCFKGCGISLVALRQIKILLYGSQSKNICQLPLKCCRCNDRTWTASFTGLGAKGFFCAWIVLNLAFHMKSAWLNPHAHFLLRQLKILAEMLNWATHGFTRLMGSHFLLCFSSSRERSLQKPHSASADSEVQISWLCAKHMGVLCKHFKLQLTWYWYLHRSLLVIQLWKWAQRMLNQWLNNRAKIVVIRAQYPY